MNDRATRPTMLPLSSQSHKQLARGIANLLTDEETIVQGYKVTGWGRDLNPGLWRREATH